MQTVHSFSQVGKRACQQDCIGIDELNGLYILCDGVGGLNFGEIASKIVVESINLNSSSIAHPININQLKKLIIRAQIDLQYSSKEVYDNAEMATTICLLYLHDCTGSILHVGDSRGYYISKSKNEFYSTVDHTVARQLYDANILTSEDQVAGHPYKNNLYRSLSSTSKITFSSIEVKKIDQFNSGDLILLCSDGVTEVFDAKKIKSKFFKSDNYKKCFKKLQSKCKKKSTDNNSAIMIEII